MEDKMTKAFDNYQGEEKRDSKIVFKQPITIRREKDVIWVHEIRKGKVGIAMVAGTDRDEKAPMPIGFLTEPQQKIIIKHLESKA